jgi:hypothetical protein
LILVSRDAGGKKDEKMTSLESATLHINTFLFTNARANARSTEARRDLAAAETLLASGRDLEAREYALSSLGHSLGGFHYIYQEAKLLAGALR